MTTSTTPDRCLKCNVEFGCDTSHYADGYCKDCAFGIMQIFETDSVNHPKHYNFSKFEVIDVIEEWGLGFNLGNVIKYIARADHKGKPIEDLKKAYFYLGREIARREKTSQ